MEVAIIQFPGSNCDQDCLALTRKGLELSTRYVWHKDTHIGEADLVIVPGGFSYGDYLRCGAIARFSPVMESVRAYAEKGGLVLGICNGFQILCEAGLLPGALICNDSLRYRCETVSLKVETVDDYWSPDRLGTLLRLPIGHGEGNYRIDAHGLSQLESNRQILFRYATEEGHVLPESNPNGSIAHIAGIRNERGNVYGMMPHPDRAWEGFHPSTDGLKVLRALLAPLLAEV